MDLDFDFPRYVERRKGLRAQEAREGAAYGYSGDLKVLRAMDGLRPVRQAIDTAARLWRQSARAELLGPGVRASERQLPRVHAAAKLAAERLHVELPVIYVSPAPVGEQLMGAYTFGTSDEAAILLHASLVDGLDDDELIFAIGRECGHLQNGHVAPRTALYFLRHGSSRFVRWVVRPAVATLQAWHRRGEVTGDRAGLLACRDLGAARLGLLKVALGAGAVEGADQTALLEAHPGLRARLAALDAFAESAFYQGVLGQPGGITLEACDEKIGEILQ